MKQKMQWGKWCFLAAILLLSLGCESLKGPVFCLSLHREVRPGGFGPDTQLIRSVVDVMGQNEHVVSRFPTLDSSSFGSVELVPDEASGRWGLRLKMDRRGKGLWRQATGEYAGSQMVVLLDGYVCGTMVIPPYDESEYLLLPPLWSESEARSIAGHVESNYRKTNRR
ncbi:MAG: hypothetical protein GX561_09865 [Lentisphaerae bacterium]|jgi:hypothetical protein|nr:hypothetical protein [Lentisphaerota bacterium]